GPRNARTRANAAYATSSSYPRTNFFFSFVFEKIVVAVISRTKRTATIWVRNPMIRARLPKNSSNVNRSANTAPPGHPVPFTKPIGFLTSLIFGQPWTKNKAPRATRPTRAAPSGYAAKTMGLPPRPPNGGRDGGGRAARRRARPGSGTARRAAHRIHHCNGRGSRGRGTSGTQGRPASVSAVLRE